MQQVEQLKSVIEKMQSEQSLCEPIEKPDQELVERIESIRCELAEKKAELDDLKQQHQELSGDYFRQMELLEKAQNTVRRRLDKENAEYLEILKNEFDVMRKQLTSKLETW